MGGNTPVKSADIVTVDISMNSVEKIGIVLSKSDLGAIVDALVIAGSDTSLGIWSRIEKDLRKLL